jgi:hypothetical protein
VVTQVLIVGREGGGADSPAICLVAPVLISVTNSEETRMTIGPYVIGGLIVAAALVALYGAHRLCLWLEQRGWLYYQKRNPTSSVAGSLVALQRALEPPTVHVIEAQETRRHAAGQEAPEEGHDSATGAPILPTGQGS